MCTETDAAVFYSNDPSRFFARKQETAFLLRRNPAVHGSEQTTGVRNGVAPGRDVIRDAFLRDVANGGVEPGQVTQEMMNELHIGIDLSVPMLLVGGRIAGSESADCAWQKEAIHHILKKHLPVESLSAHWKMQRGVAVWAVQAKDGDPAGAGRIAQALADTTVDCGNMLGIDVRFLAGERAISFHELPQAAGVLLQRMERARSGGGKTVDAKRECMLGYIDAGDEGGAVSIPMLEQMESMLLRGQKSEYLDLLRKLWYGPGTSQRMDGLFMTELYYSFVLVLLRCAQRIAAARGAQEEALAEMRPKDPGEFSDRDEAYEYVRKTAEAVLALCEPRKESYEIHLLRNVKKYVDEHAYDCVSLADIAVYTKYNPAYISRIFKKYKGINLSAYVNQIRMDKAKEFLAHSDMSVYEVANRVGFESPQYFATVFKKSTGLSPKQYRLAKGNG